MSYPLLLSLVVAVAGGAQGRYEERTFDRTEGARGVSRVVVKLKIASLKVVTDRSNDVNIHIVRRVRGGTAERRRWWLDTPRYEVNSRGGTLKIEEILPDRQDRDRDWSKDNFNMEVQAELHVPARMDLELMAGVGNIEASRTEGALSAATGAGNITLRDILNRNDDVDVRTGAGNVILSGRIGNLDVVTGAGNVHAKGVSCEGRNVSFQTGAGQIEADLDRVPSSKLSLQSGVGSVRLSLPNGSRSRIVSDSREGRRAPGRRQHGPENLGGTLIGEVGNTRVSLSTGIGSLNMTTRGR